MKKLLVTLFLITGIAFAQTGDPAGFHFWTRAELEAKANATAPHMDAHKLSDATLATAGNHRFLVSHREAPGQSEYHATESDIAYIVSGEATLTYGGKMINPQTTAPNEMRGSGIEGGSNRTLRPGDVVVIPPKVPHQLSPEKGKTFDYFVVKVTEQ
jgi:mannose-6-phosphate isomerase-like protein (cupin superfamily)